jgi:hypothetical protein
MHDPYGVIVGESDRIAGQGHYHVSHDAGDASGIFMIMPKNRLQSGRMGA